MCRPLFKMQLPRSLYISPFFTFLIVILADKVRLRERNILPSVTLIIIYNVIYQAMSLEAVSI